ncbi:TY-Chap domain-containing protein [Nocardia fluminea]|uniref:TY-Chap domain-containing protein n=1 Tax=Nocardia fluminea TaxID=134984 RepID=UPI0037FAC3C8
MSDWATFTDHLASELDELPTTSRVIIFEPEPASGRRFVQFARDEHVLSAQLVGSRSLEPERQPDAAGWRAITRAGWHQPDAANAHLWWVDFDAPVTMDDCRRAAAIAVTGLRDGYGITSPDTLVYDAWVERTGTIDLHTLGLKQQRM